MRYVIGPAMVLAALLGRSVSMYTSALAPMNQSGGNCSTVTSASRSSVTRSASSASLASRPGNDLPGCARKVTRAGWPTRNVPATSSSTIAVIQSWCVSAMRKIGAPGTTVPPTSRLRVITSPDTGL